MSLYVRSGDRGLHAHAYRNLLPPVSIPGAKHEKSGWPDQQIISANQQVYFWNLSYMFMLSPQELSPKVCISAGNGCILHALKYYNVGFALLDLYIMRGALTWGEYIQGGKRLVTISMVVLRVGKRGVSQKNLVSRQNSTKEAFQKAGRESVDVGNNFIKSTTYH